MLLARDFIFKRGAAGLEALRRDYAVTSRRGTRHPSLVLLKYHQFESPMHEPIVQECRALILNEADYWRPVAFPYRKFFNLGEPNAESVRLDWSSARVYEKVDGSLVTLYPYRDGWEVSTSGVPDAETPTGGACSLSFRALFWETWHASGYRLPEERDHVYMFELMAPENRVIVPHAARALALHGVRDMVTLDEKRPEGFAEKYGWSCVRTFPFGTASEVLSAAKVLRPLECEGYVVVDRHWNRLKVKGPAYVALSHAKDTLSPKYMLDLARKGEGAEYLSYFPEMEQAYAQQIEALRGLLEAVERTFAALRDRPTQKDFALEAVKYPFSSVLFALRAGKVQTAAEYLATCNQSTAQRLAHGVEASEG